MKAVLLASANSNPFHVYTPAVWAEICQTLDMYPTPLHTENAEAHLSALQSAEVAFSTWGMPVFTEEQIERWMPNLKAIFYSAGSVQFFARPFLNRGIRVFSAWGANAVPVAEFTASQILLANKGTFHAWLIRAQQGYEAARDLAHSFPGNKRVRVGLLGLGMIGSLVAKELMRHDVEVWAYDPFCSEEKAASLGTTLHSLEEIFAECLCVSNHIANLPTTQHMLNYSHFSLMPKNAVLINTGRAQQLNQPDLARALKEEPGRILVADVTDPEPPAADDPLYSLPNVFVTPHIAGSLGNEPERHAEYMLREYEAFAADKPVQWEVTIPMLETMA